jgi:hypothetical protein
MAQPSWVAKAVGFCCQAEPKPPKLEGASPLHGSLLTLSWIACLVSLLRYLPLPLPWPWPAACRMLSNRESARRSRRRRQTHVSALESQVEALRGEKERLEGELSSTAQQMRAVVAEKQRLQLEVEGLRRKVGRHV